MISGNAAYLADEGTGGGCFDGTWAVNLPDGSLKWVNHCLGATQTVAVVGTYLYKGSHAHDCQPAPTRNGDPDNFPQVPTRPGTCSPSGWTTASSGRGTRSTTPARTSARAPWRPTAPSSTSAATSPR